MTGLTAEEMHRLAAKAAGYIFGMRLDGNGLSVPCIKDEHADWERWAPSANQRQSTMLSKILKMEIIHPYYHDCDSGEFVKCCPKHFSDCSAYTAVVSDTEQAIREAIFLAAVKVGQQL